MAAVELFSTGLFARSSCISYYRMEGNSNDAKGSNTGVDTSMSYSAGNGKFNQGAGFNGTSSRIIPSSQTGIPSGSANYSFVAWVKYTAAGTIVGLGVTGTNNLANVLKFGSTTTIINYWWGNDLTATIPAIDSNWHHVAATFDGTTRRIYYDGASVNSDTPVGKNTTASNFKIGEFQAEYWSGSLDDVAVFNVALTAQEILALYQGGVVQQAISDSTDKSSADPWDFTHVVTAGTDLMLVVSVSSFSRHPTGVTYNSVALTQQQSAINGSIYASIWYLKNPATGSNTISVDFTAGTYGRAGGISFTGADQTTQPDASATENGTSATTNSLDITTVAANTYIVDAFSLDQSLLSTGPTKNSAQTLLYNRVAGALFVAGGGSYKESGTAGAKTMVWTWTVSASTISYAHVGMSINPTATASSGFLPRKMLLGVG